MMDEEDVHLGDAGESEAMSGSNGHEAEENHNGVSLSLAQNGAENEKAAEEAAEHDSEAESQPPVLLVEGTANASDVLGSTATSSVLGTSRSLTSSPSRATPLALTEVDLMREIGNFMDGEEDEPREALLERIKELERDRGQLASEALEKDDVIGRMEREVASMKSDVNAAEEEKRQSAEEAETKYNRLKEETDKKIEELKKLFSAANRDKESMVVKYAMGEKEVIVQRRGKEKAEGKLKAVTTERDTLNEMIKKLNADKAKLQQLADSRLQDVSVVRKEVDRWQEEVKVQEAKACVAASRLKAEVDAHRETRESLDKTIKHLAETREEIEVTRKECADFMQRIKDEEKEASAKLIIDAAAANEMDTLREKYKQVIEENNTLSVKVQNLEKERLESDAAVSRLKETVAAQNREISDLLAQVAEMESLRMQLQREEEKCAAKAAEVERLRQEAAEIGEDMAACRRKEAEMLDFTQKLTDKNVSLQSNLTALEARSAAMEVEHSRLVGKVSELETSLSQTTVELTEEKKKRQEETELLAKKLAEKSRMAETQRQKTLDAENEVLVVKRKNAASLRELTRELQTCQKRLDQHNQLSVSAVAAASAAGGATSPSRYSSRASSDVSLNKSGDDVSNTLVVKLSDHANGLRSPTLSASVRLKMD